MLTERKFTEPVASALVEAMVEARTQSLSAARTTVSLALARHPRAQLICYLSECGFGPWVGVPTHGDLVALISDIALGAPATSS